MSSPLSIFPRHLRRTATVSVLVGTAAALLATASPASAIPATGAEQPRSEVSCTSDKTGLANRLREDIQAVVEDATLTGRVSVALYDRTTGTECAFNADQRYDSASVVKVIVLGALLRRAQDESRDLTSSERTLTTKMITASDNNATTTLWKRLGLARISDFLRLAGMEHTTPDPAGYWGLTQINAADQLRLMELLTSANSVLDDDRRAYALGLMNQVIPAQRWGVPAGAPSEATVHVKNGWLQRSSGGWRVHSVGAFTGQGHDYGLAVLTADNTGMPASVAVIENIARRVHADLNGTTLVPLQEQHRQDLPNTSDGSLVPDGNR
ncbi:class A beta-lactamase-related serine hydrolase [Streptomyces scopuliridis]|uniref:Class A beta-lactamase-related serine hydrolase n=1 Tax=Streptomyces scopuliridis TaxID=452529 RepID=A0ACD4ZR33_9ACTN|nr:serine hydrolase [Streptomyces scopuliridis]WSC00655.1 class A beta-lactamase-related serine hydrolase [Streptomyces scopuliridis]WSC05734.1 class A beta-lactamase-related serine hydrolase [Streptomyces scopuliridis]